MTLLERRARRALLPMNSGPEGFQLTAEPPLPPTAPGESIKIRSEANEELARLRFYVTPGCAEWQIDQITIDGQDLLDAPRPAVDFKGTEIADGTGRIFEVRATNAGRAPSYFYCSFAGTVAT